MWLCMRHKYYYSTASWEHFWLVSTSKRPNIGIRTMGISALHRILAVNIAYVCVSAISSIEHENSIGYSSRLRISNIIWEREFNMNDDHDHYSYMALEFPICNCKIININRERSMIVWMNWLLRHKNRRLKAKLLVPRHWMNLFKLS